MSKFFDETMQGLLEAVAIEKGEVPIEEKENMPAPTFIASDKEKELIDTFGCISVHPFHYKIFSCSAECG